MRSASDDLIKPRPSLILIDNSNDLIKYKSALEKMDTIVNSVASGVKAETVWFLQHPEIYTAGTSANEKDLLAPNRFPVYKTGRGGRFTYHGPGQVVGYVILNLKNQKKDVRAYIHNLEKWIINTLRVFGVVGERRPGRVGIWVVTGVSTNGDPIEKKIAAIGVRIRNWITFHGVSLNVNPILEHFDGIVPCGIKEHGVTSLADLGVHTQMEEVVNILKENFEETFECKLLPETNSSQRE